MSDAGDVMQRAQDKIADMQARAGAIDELLASGALTDLTSSTDDIQAQLDKVGAASQVDQELARLKSELAAANPAVLPSGAPEPSAAEASSSGQNPAAAPPAEPSHQPAEPSHQPEVNS